MNIVWLTWKDRYHPLAGGAEVVTHHLAKQLVADGHTVTLLTAGYAGASHRDMIDGYNVVRVGNRLSVYVAAYRYFRKHFRGTADLVVDEVNTLPFFSRFYTSTRTVMLYHQLCRQVWFYELPAYIGWIGYLAERVYTQLFRGLTTIAMSESTKVDLVRYGLKPHDITVISEGIEIEPIADLAKVTKFTQPTLLSLGSLRSMKRTLDQVKAFELARDRMPDLKLIIAGNHDNSYGQRVVAFARQSRHHSDITILGRVSDEKRLELMQRSHVVLQTAVKEGWGLTITEANSQGTPAVAYDVDGLRDSVQHQQTGIITSQSPAALADGIVELLDNTARYETMRRRAYEFSKTITFQQTYNDFKGAISL